MIDWVCLTRHNRLLSREASNTWSSYSCRCSNTDSCPFCLRRLMLIRKCLQMYPIHSIPLPQRQWKSNFRVNFNPRIIPVAVVPLPTAVWWGFRPIITCTEQQQHLHAEVLLVGHLQSDKLIADLQHLLTLVVHEGQLHALSERGETHRLHFKLFYSSCNSIGQWNQLWWLFAPHFHSNTTHIAFRH